MKLPLISLLILSPILAQSAVYDTLPIGVNTFVFKQVTTNKIESKYDASSTDKAMLLNENFTTSKLSAISDSIKSFFDELKSISPDAFNTFSLGEFQAKAWAQVNAQGLGFGRGITDRLTVYGSLPIYHLKTDVNFYQTSPSNLVQIKNLVLNSNPTTAVGTFIKELVLQLPNSNEALLQSVLVNHYGYKPLGHWEADALGDADMGFIYRLTDYANAGSAISIGAVLPTGRQDDPDNLQDIATGDGQYDIYIESLNGFSLYDKLLQFELKTKYTYQFASDKKLRLYSDPSTPLSSDSGIVNEKLGNKIDSTFTFTVSPKSWYNINTSFIYNYTGKSEYKINDPAIKNALEDGTESINEWVRIGFGLSTIEMYKKKQFELPMEMNLSAQKIINAKNAANYERFDLDFRFYF